MSYSVFNVDELVGDKYFEKEPSRGDTFNLNGSNWVVVSVVGPIIYVNPA